MPPLLLSAHRDIGILALFSQLAVCDDNMQSVNIVIENSLTFYGIKFNGWQMAGLDSDCVRAATIVNLFVMGIYLQEKCSIK